jgi:O-antigen ligase
MSSPPFQATIAAVTCCAPAPSRAVSSINLGRHDTLRHLTRRLAFAPPYPVTLALAVAAAALAPAYVVRWHIAFYPTTALEVALIATIVACVVESRLAGLGWIARSPLAAPTLAFLIAGAVSVIDAPSKLSAVGIFRAYIAEPVLVAMAIVVATRSAGAAYAIVAGFCAGAVVLAVLDSATVLAGFSTHTLGQAGEAPVAVYNNSNSVALFLVPLFAVTASIALHGRGTYTRAAFGTFAGIAAATTILTLSRGGWAALAAVACALALPHRRRWWLLAGIFILGLALAFIPAISFRIAAEFRVTAAGAFSGRGELWPNTLRMLETRPILGAGLSGFMPTMASVVPHYKLLVMYPHNIILNFWSEMGLLGLVSFTAILLVTAWISWNCWRHGPISWRPIHLGVLLALLAIVVHGVVDVPYFKNDLAFEFWGLVALTMAGAREAGPAIFWPGRHIGRDAFRLWRHSSV